MPRVSQSRSQTITLVQTGLLSLNPTEALMLSCAIPSQASRQKSPVSPSWSRIAWYCSSLRGCQSGASSSLAQACASSLSLATGMIAPGSRVPSHRWMCSSDRKRFIVFQVKTTSSHQRAAGTSE
jgi:hypothetical protein